MLIVSLPFVDYKLRWDEDNKGDSMVSLEKAQTAHDLCDSVGEVEAAKQMGISVESVHRYCRIQQENTAIAKSEGYGPKILLYDLETAPNLAYVWGFFKQNIAPSQVVEFTDVLCWSAKWLGNEAILCESREDDESDERICRSLWELFDEADIVVAHNGRGFDQKIMNLRWMAMGMQPPSPYKDVDTLKVAKGAFRFPSNKLDGIARYLNIGTKRPHEGFALWTKCLAGDAEAWETMRLYNIQDVVLLEKVYLKLRPWSKDGNMHPNVALMYEDNQTRCVVCGSTALKEIPQPSHTSVSTFPSIRCKTCGKVMRTGTRDKNDKVVLRHSL